MSAARAAARRLVLPASLLALCLGLVTLVADLPPDVLAPLGPRPVRLLAQLVAAAAWLALAFLVIRLLDFLLWCRRTPRPARLLTDLVGAVIWVVTAMIIAVRVAGMPPAGILTTSGVTVAVLGFALRDMLASLFAGIALNVERPYRLGDWLEVGPGQVGRVVEVSWLTTRLVTLDGIGIVVPNAQLATRGFTNFDQTGEPWRDQIALTLGYEISAARAERILLAAAAEVPWANAAGRRPDVKIEACGEAGVVYLLRYWLRDYGQRAEIRHQVHMTALRHLYKAGLGPAYRRVDLFHAPMPPRALDTRTRLDSLLARSDLFHSLPEAEIASLAQAARRCRFHAGQAVVRQGEEGSSLFVVVEGVLDVDVTSPSGTARVRSVGPGDMFGEYSLLTGAPRSATVTARTGCLLFELTREALLPVMERCPALADEVSRTLASRQAERLSADHPRRGLAEDGTGESSGLLRRIRAFFGLDD